MGSAARSCSPRARPTGPRPTGSGGSSSRSGSRSSGSRRRSCAADPVRRRARRAARPVVAPRARDDRRAMEPGAIPLAVRARRRLARPIINCSGGTRSAPASSRPLPRCRSRNARWAGLPWGWRWTWSTPRAARARRGRRARLPQALPRNDARLLARSRALSGHVLAAATGRVGARRLGVVDEDGFWFLQGRSDDTLNIAGKRLGPAELESAVVAHPSVAEAAAVGVPHEVKGDVAWVFCALVPGAAAEELAGEIGSWPPQRSGRRSGPNGWSSSPRCRRRGVRRSSGAPFGRRRSAAIRATSRRWRTPRPWRRSNVSQPADRLDGQIALVTGGGRGIGARIARELASAGARVAVAARTREQVEEVAQEITGLALEVDVTDLGAVEQMVAKTKNELGPIDLLAANAGIGNVSRRHLGGRPRRVVARPRGQRARRLQLLPRRDPGDARARLGPDRDHRQRRRLPPGREQHRLHLEQGRGQPAPPRRSRTASATRRFGCS